MALELSFKTDLGFTNLSKAAGWITTELYWKYGMDSQFTFYTGNAGKKSVDAVVNRQVDLAFITPLALAEMAVKGKGMFDKAHDELRALAVFPHFDQHVLAVRKNSGFHSYEDVFKPARPISIITATRDEDNLMGAAFDQLLALFGSDFETWQKDGGQFICFDSPFLALTEMAKGKADALFFEAFMVPLWWNLTEKVDLTFLSLPEKCKIGLQEWGARVVTLHPDGKKGFDQPIVTLDWSGWVLLSRSDLPDHVAESISEIIVTKHLDFVAEYAHIPPSRSALRYPILPSDFVKTGDVPLHFAARTVYEQYGLFN
ncbi:hypothetical protein [Brevibacillus sp. NRS-1366]|uniref:hypothetical protein n=1 Tax=Brevibacillus sp. NRS-1366 TaxID=3233899 RepID=UPI003D204935